MPEIQDRRKPVTVPGGRPLHEYVNLYICARNPMMFKLKGEHGALCILRVSTDVLDLPDVVVTDRNAASEYVRCGPAPAALSLVDREWLFARYWTLGYRFEVWRRLWIECSVFLV